MCCCINAQNVKLYLQSSVESLSFYLKCQFVQIKKFPPNVSDADNVINGLPCCRCESVINLNPQEASIKISKVTAKPSIDFLQGKY